MLSFTKVELELPTTKVTLSKLYPCAFLFRKLSTAERSYDLENQNLLVIEAALEECFGGGAKSQFTRTTNMSKQQWQ